MREQLLRLGLAVVLAGPAAACATGAPTAADSYNAGYTDGCVTGFSDAGKPGFESVYRRDDKRFIADAEYQRGWTEGEKSCYTAEMNFPTMSGMADRGVFRGP
ncbi:MAG: hypothetical protein U1F33_17820 [Alphaproteobacteria bacterium]